MANKVELKDRKTKETVYPVTHVDCIVDPEKTIVKEAPQDGKYYARKDGEWVELPVIESKPVEERFVKFTVNDKDVFILPLNTGDDSSYPTRDYPSAESFWYELLKAPIVTTMTRNGDIWDSSPVGEYPYQDDSKFFDMELAMGYRRDNTGTKLVLSIVWEDGRTLCAVLVKDVVKELSRLYPGTRIFEIDTFTLKIEAVE